jgi:hypothetical protein
MEVSLITFNFPVFGVGRQIPARTRKRKKVEGEKKKKEGGGRGRD